jgi:excinuclease ABC subunit A
VHRLDEPPQLDKKRKHVIDLVIDRLTVEGGSRGRIAEAVELGLREGKGEILVDLEEGSRLVFSAVRAC